MGRAWVAGLVGALLGCGNAPQPAPKTGVLVPDAAPSPPSAPEPVVSAPPPPESKPAAPAARDCGDVVNPPAADWPTLEGCRVAFEAGRVAQHRECTMMMCSQDRPCCNGCSAGPLGFSRGPDALALSRDGEPLTCKVGRDCDAQRDCAAPPGPANVTGVLWRKDDVWLLDVEQVVHRVGSCARSTVATSEANQRVRCEATYECARGREARVTCEGQTESHVSQCTCQIGARKVQLPRVYGEPPSTCDRALVACGAK